MTDITKDHVVTMGQTGEGLTSADQIDMEKDNELTNKWAIIRSSCPWFFEMRDLIAERPNIVPAGLGNSTDVIDMAAYTNGTSTGTGDAAASSPEPEQGLEDDHEDAGDNGPAGVELEIGAGKTPARPGISQPATRAPKERTKKRKGVDFGEIAEYEELTRQKELEVAKAKLETKKAGFEHKRAKLAESGERQKERAAEKAYRRQLQQQFRQPAYESARPASSFSIPQQPHSHFQQNNFSLDPHVNDLNTDSWNTVPRRGLTESTSFYRAASPGPGFPSASSSRAGPSTAASAYNAMDLDDISSNLPEALNEFDLSGVSGSHSESGTQAEEDGRAGDNEHGEVVDLSGHGV